MGILSQRLRLTLIVIISISVKLSEACQGHKLVLSYIKDCGDIDKPVITMYPNATLELTDDCQVIPNVCAETIGFKTAIVKYKIWKNNLVVLQGTINACDALSKVNDDIKAMMKMFAIPTKCPFEAMKKCEDGSKKGEVLERFRKFIALARGGPIKTEIKIQHDNGESCFKSEMEVVKKTR